MLRAVIQIPVLAITTAFSLCGVLLLAIFQFISYPCTSRKPHGPPKKILITGATSGLGAELALYYAAKYKDGVFLALTGRNKGALKEVEDKCRALGVSQFSTSSIDVTDRDRLCSWIQDLNKDTPLDLVIANAGITEDTAKVRGNIEEGARQCMDVNVGGVFNTVFPALTGMRSRGSGQVCVISSVASFVPFSIFDGYSASKVAIRYWTEGLRYRVASEGIRVTCVCPGYIHGPMTEAFNGRVPLIGAVSMQYAASRIAEGLLRDEGLIVFPEGVGMLTWALSLLPWDLKDALARTRLFKELRYGGGKKRD